MANTPHLNVVVLAGRLVREPETKTTSNKTAVCTFDLAVPHRFSGAEGGQKETTSFLRIVTFGRQAEACGSYLKKGRLVLVDGEIRQNRYNKDGRFFNNVQVNAKSVQFLQEPRSKKPEEEAECQSLQDEYEQTLGEMGIEGEEKRDEPTDAKANDKDGGGEEGVPF